LTKQEAIAAAEENGEAVFEFLAKHTPQAKFHRDEHMRRMHFGVPASFFNGVAMAHLTADNSDALIREAIQEMAQSGLPWSWQLAPSSTPDDLSHRLIDHGMKHAYDLPIMIADLSNWHPKPPPQGFESVFVDNPQTYKQFEIIAQQSFGLPDVVMNVFTSAQAKIGFGQDSPLRNFVGFANGEPVSTGTVFYGHGIAGIYTIGTPDAHRGHGYGTAITEACMADAIARGFDTAFLQASKMGYRVYEKIGFQEICKLNIYIPVED